MIKRAFCLPETPCSSGASGTFSLTLLTSAIGTALAISAVGSAAAEETPVFDGELSGINNAYPVVRFEFSSHQLAHKTQALLYERGGNTVIVRGHSIGGMLATRFALMCPYQTEHLVLVNSIGLEDWKALGVPYQNIDEGYESELETTAEGIRDYQQSTYYVDNWEPEYDRWVEMLAGMYEGEDGELVAWNQALTSDMVFTQPVVHEFGELEVPTLLLIGEQDNTAIGKGRAPEDVQEALGHYDELGEQTRDAIPQATLIAFPELGHSP